MAWLAYPVSAGAGDGGAETPAAGEAADGGHDAATVEEIGVWFGDLDHNDVSREIFGVWKVERELSERVGGVIGLPQRDGETGMPRPNAVKVTFSESEAATKACVNALGGLLTLFPEDAGSARCHSIRSVFSRLWASGEYDFGEHELGKGIFAVVSLEGNPCLLLMQAGVNYARAKEEGLELPRGLLVQVSRDLKGDRDVLWLREESRPVSAWVREGEAPKRLERKDIAEARAKQEAWLASRAPVKEAKKAEAGAEEKKGGVAEESKPEGPARGR